MCCRNDDNIVARHGEGAHLAVLQASFSRCGRVTRCVMLVARIRDARVLAGRRVAEASTQ